MAPGWWGVGRNKRYPTALRNAAASCPAYDMAVLGPTPVHLLGAEAVQGMQ